MIYAKPLAERAGSLKLPESAKDSSDRSISTTDIVADGSLTEVTQATLERLRPHVVEADRARVAVIIEETISEISHHSGPLPRPSDMAQYEVIKPGFAERIMRLAEKEQDHRHAFTDGLVKRDYNLKTVGQYFAMASVLVFLGFAAYLGFLGDTRSAAFVASVAVGVVGIFITRRQPRATSEQDD
jgi:uncharacterized membrane protein